MPSAARTMSMRSTAELIKQEMATRNKEEEEDYEDLEDLEKEL